LKHTNNSAYFTNMDIPVEHTRDRNGRKVHRLLGYSFLDYTWQTFCFLQVSEQFRAGNRDGNGCSWQTAHKITLCVEAARRESRERTARLNRGECFNPKRRGIEL